ncbi:protein translocase subunit yidC [Sulfuritortus calidifontis]|uniref:Membrane protein insertase YidC n=1 Tax=Sulfuritortus calidifontis TaxID=1914471 RepID=A0A4R3JW29_9PROT|nr:membrane protein insertase YidC [Sulfuritortus calidifontis]TCS70729.1 protein translocase subunit yidC [Sulfuritortus calidifontis]
MDTQRLIAFVVFSFSLLMLWEAWQDYNKPKQPSAAVAQQAAPSQGALPTPGQALQATDAASETPKGGAAKGARAVIKTDVLTAVIDANGGDIRELDLSHYHQDEDKTKPFRLLEERQGRNYFAQSGLIGHDLPNHKTVFELVPGERELKPGQDVVKLTLRAQSGGVELTKTYSFRRGSYAVELEQTVRNLGQATVDAFPYYQLMRHSQAPEGQSALMHTFTGPAVYTEASKFQKIDFKKIAEGKAEHVKEAQDGWVAMVQHHFVSAWLTQNPTDSGRREFYTRALGNDEYAAGMILPVLKLAPGESKSVATRLYAGPQEQDKLKALAPGLDLVVDYGWLHVLAYPLFMLLNWLNKLVDNWGVAIILLTVLIKGAFYPLSAASYKSMAQMRKLAPRLQSLKEKFGDDRQKLHEAMMKIYQEEKINPLGGCLPILVQIPVFIALYWVLLGAVELRQAPFALWITDLSASDPYYVLPVVMAITMFIQQKLSPTPPDPVQAKVMMIMPIVFSVFFFFFPAGLVLYWLVNNVLSILQQWRINTVIERAGKK